MKLGRGELHIGHVLDVLRRLPEESVDCCVTSPPYWGLRDYQTEPQIFSADPDCDHDWKDAGGGLLHENRNFTTGPQDNPVGAGPLTRIRDEAKATSWLCSHCGAWKGELGSEPSLELYVNHLVEIFREVRRVLKPEGTCWLNLGDSYVGSPPGIRGKYARGEVGDGAYKRRWDRQLGHGEDKQRIWQKPRGLKPKDLCMVPARVALALQADGWWLRSEIIWAKGATTPHGNEGNVMPESCKDRPTSANERIYLLTKKARYYYNQEAERQELATSSLAQLATDYSGQGTKDYSTAGAQNPSDIKRRIVRSGNKARKQISPRGQAHSVPWESDGSGSNLRNVWRMNVRAYPEKHYAVFPVELPLRCINLGTPGEGAEPAVVLDPFMGSGTTAEAAERLRRAWLGIDLDGQNVELVKKRVSYGAAIGAQETLW